MGASFSAVTLRLDSHSRGMQHYPLARTVLSAVWKTSVDAPDVTGSKRGLFPRSGASCSWLIRGLESPGECLDRLPDGPGTDLVPRSVQVQLRSEEHTSELQSRQYLVCRL